MLKLTFVFGIQKNSKKQRKKTMLKNEQSDINQIEKIKKIKQKKDKFDRNYR